MRLVDKNPTGDVARREGVGGASKPAAFSRIDAGRLLWQGMMAERGKNLPHVMLRGLVKIAGMSSQHTHIVPTGAIGPNR